MGGLAVSVRSDPRFTRDVDLAVAVESDRDAESLVLALGYPVRATVEHTKMKRLATVRLSAPTGSRAPPVVDLLFASSGIEAEIAAAAEKLEVVEGLTLPVASRAHLIAMKVLAERDGREQDRIDLDRLLRGASARELEAARASLHLIEARGYNREKALDARLDELLSAITSEGS